jgi:hypothetical protein
MGDSLENVRQISAHLSRDETCSRQCICPQAFIRDAPFPKIE